MDIVYKIFLTGIIVIYFIAIGLVIIERIVKYKIEFNKKKMFVQIAVMIIPYIIGIILMVISAQRKSVILLLVSTCLLFVFILDAVFESVASAGKINKFMIGWGIVSGLIIFIWAFFLQGYRDAEEEKSYKIISDNNKKYLIVNENTEEYSSYLYECKDDDIIVYTNIHHVFKKCEVETIKVEFDVRPCFKEMIVSDTLGKE